MYTEINGDGQWVQTSCGRGRGLGRQRASQNCNVTPGMWLMGRTDGRVGKAMPLRLV